MEIEISPSPASPATTIGSTDWIASTTWSSTSYTDDTQPTTANASARMGKNDRRPK